MARPVVGITTYVTDAKWGYWNLEAALIPFDYVRAVERSGGRAMLVPPSLEGIDETLDALDAVIFTGGSDLDPELYGADAAAETSGVVRMRDEAELALLRAALDRDMPVLGICRGMQLLNVSRGGTLLQHLPDEVGHADHRINPGSFDGADHDVQLDPESLAARAAGEEVHVTKSHHHQGVDVVGEGLRVTGHSALGDELPEAVEAPGRRFVLGVQWHPEADETSTVIGALVQQARDYRSTRGSA